MIMTRIAKLLALSWLERWLLLQASVLLGGTWLALRLLSFAQLQRLLQAAASRQGPISAETQPPVESIAAALKRAHRCMPSASCLPQAMAAQYLLLHYGHPAELRLGAAKDDDGRVRAHAWVVSGNQIVIGDLPDLASYAPLAAGKAE